MPTIRFTRPYVVKNHEGRHFVEGELLECNPATANHFISRKAAVLVAEEVPKPAPDPRPEPPLKVAKAKPRKVADEP